MDKTDDFLQHWGIKGMKWKDIKPFDNAINKETPAQAKLRLKLAQEKAKKDGEEYARTQEARDMRGARWERNAESARKDLAKIHAQEGSDYKKLKKQQYDLQHPIHTITTKVKDISSSAIKRGKSFIESLFKR